MKLTEMKLFTDKRRTKYGAKAASKGVPWHSTMERIVALCFGDDPTSVIYNQKEMRAHLLLLEK